MSNIKISIVVPVLNGIHTLPEFFEGIRKQNLASQSEIIIIDSGSTDGSIEYVKEQGAQLVEIEKKDFNHGATRNLGVLHAQGEFIFFTVQDAWTQDSFLLDKMLKHFQDAKVVGVCGQQIVPHQRDKNPHEWFRPFSIPKPRIMFFKNKAEFDSLSPQEQRQVCGWDDVIAMYRKEILLEIPFQSVVYGEDMLWAKDVLLRGYTIVYDYNARVNHYHFQYPEYTFRRRLISNLFAYKNFKCIRDFKYSNTDFLKVIYRNFKWNCHPKWILHNFRIMQAHNRAVKIFLKAIQDNALVELERDLSNNVPLGKQKK